MGDVTFIPYFSDEELEEFIRKIVTASQAGVLATNNVTFDSSWTFGQAFFFVGTLVTTVGKWVLFCKRSVRSMGN